MMTDMVSQQMEGQDDDEPGTAPEEQTTKHHKKDGHQMQLEMERQLALKRE